MLLGCNNYECIILKDSMMLQWCNIVLVIFLTLRLFLGCHCQGQTQCLCLQDVVPENELRTTVRLKPLPDGSGRMLAAETVGSLSLLFSVN